jgi:hypothetical protein
MEILQGINSGKELARAQDLRSKAAKHSEQIAGNTISYLKQSDRMLKKIHKRLSKTVVSAQLIVDIHTKSQRYRENRKIPSLLTIELAVFLNIYLQEDWILKMTGLDFYPCPFLFLGH